MKDARIVVAGAGGFIGGHLVRQLTANEASNVVAVDCKPLADWYQLVPGVDSRSLDLSQRAACDEALAGADSVYNLAADMGGMGFIENNKALCMLSVLINTHLLMSARRHGVRNFFFSSSACIYPVEIQQRADIPGLVETDAYPANPEDGYGWEKLFSERMCRHFAEDFGIRTRVARYHNVYGPHGSWTGGREKAPAAICRKVAEAKLSGRHEIEVWGDGEQTRSFMYIDDCTRGTEMIMQSALEEPINLGSTEMVTINELVDLVEQIAGIRVERRYNLGAPKGVRGRTCDNTMIVDRLGWEPSTPLITGLEATYGWIFDQVSALQPATNA
jgi:nucleoside-diphosphate-sugar epimerase